MTSAADIVGDARWFGGVHVFAAGRVLLTIGGENPQIPGPPPPRAHVRWIGGSPLPGESFAECAVREAREELGGDVELLHTERTAVEVKPATAEWRLLDDRPAPLLVQRYLGGEVLVVYRARLLSEPHPADVERLAWVEPRALDPLCEGVAPADAARAGIEVLGPPLDPSAKLFLGPAGAEYLLYRLRVDDPNRPKRESKLGVGPV